MKSSPPPPTGNRGKLFNAQHLIFSIPISVASLCPRQDVFPQIFSFYSFFFSSPLERFLIYVPVPYTFQYGYSKEKNLRAMKGYRNINIILYCLFVPGQHKELLFPEWLLCPHLICCLIPLIFLCWDGTPVRYLHTKIQIHGLRGLSCEIRTWCRAISENETRFIIRAL
jgi:hypothetical protein